MRLWFVCAITSGVLVGQAPAPTPQQVERGKEVFLTRTCVMCHAVQGIHAFSRAGPDLTNLASRPTIAAGTLPNTRGYLAGWILNPRNLKPGTKMPASALTHEELDALLAFLATLK